MATPSNDALTDHQLEQLDDFLVEINKSCANVEALDGLFSALICTPIPPAPSEFLPYVLEDYQFPSQAKAAEIVELLLCHWNSIAQGLRQAMAKRDVHLPLLWAEENEKSYGNDWATGFMEGVRLTREYWSEYLYTSDNEEEMENSPGHLFPILALAHEFDPDPELRPNWDEQGREQALTMMVASLNLIYQGFEPERQSKISEMTRTPIRSIKIGRNDPCPCGSARKYKHCCLNAPTQVH